MHDIQPHLIVLKQLQQRDWLDYLGIIFSGLTFAAAAAGVYVAYSVGAVVQRELTNRRILKDHFIREILEVRQEYLNLIRRLLNGEVKCRDVQTLFRQISMRVDDLAPILNEEFGCDANTLSDCHLQLLTGIEKIPEYENGWTRNREIFASYEGREALREIGTRSYRTFNQVVRQINEAN